MQPIIDELDNTITCYNMQNNTYIQSLYDAEYWQSKASYVGLTREEHEYVIDHPIIHVGYLKNSYPLQYTDDEGRFGGISRRFLIIF